MFGNCEANAYAGREAVCGWNTRLFRIEYEERVDRDHDAACRVADPADFNSGRTTTRVSDFVNRALDFDACPSEEWASNTGGPGSGAPTD